MAEQQSQTEYISSVADIASEQAATSKSGNGTYPISHVKTWIRYGGYYLCERLFDVVSSLFLLIALSPLIVVCLFIKWVEDAIHPKYELLIEPADLTKKPGKRTTRITRADGMVLFNHRGEWETIK